MTDKSRSRRARLNPQSLRSRFTAAAVALTVGVLGALAPLGATPAQAESNAPNTVLIGENIFYVYAAAGDVVTAEFIVNELNPTQGQTFSLTDPSGAVRWTCDLPPATAAETTCTVPAGMTGPDGVWLLETDGIGAETPNWPAGSGNDTRWDITVLSGGAPIEGRVWSKQYRAYSSFTPGSGTAFPNSDLSFWVVSENGSQYTVEMPVFNGGGWSFSSDAFGNVIDPALCTPAYRSLAQTSNSPEHQGPGPECGPGYNLFFEAPSADLPDFASSADGDEFVNPDYVTPSFDDTTYTRTNALSHAGALSYDLNNFTGNYVVRVDVDGNGSYTDPLDVTLPQSGTDGAVSAPWDGRDSAGTLVDVCTTVNLEVAIEKTDEIHFVLGDVEVLPGGIRITQIVGSSAGNDTIYWDDTEVPLSGVGPKSTTSTPVVNLAGLSSAGFIHGWASTGTNQWGNFAAIDNWAYGDIDVSAQASSPGNCLTLTKTSDATVDTRPGDDVEYTVTATNTGEEPYTAANPAVVTDDLTAVLDDATYNGDATATMPGTIAYAAPDLTWTGPLAVGQSMTLTYTATVAAGGDGIARNVVFSGTPDTPTPACNPPNGDGVDPTTGIACAEAEFLLPKLSVTKAADTTELPADGGVVEYTITATNTGPGAYTAAEPARVTDDLSAVLDDATFGGITSPTDGSAELVGEELTWVGPLASGESVTITYTATYDSAAGDNILYNLVCIPTDETAAGQDDCASVRIPAAELVVDKTVDPESGTAVDARQVVTYTLSFESVGEAAAAVDKVDDLSDVLDDAELVAGSITTSNPGLTAELQGTDLIVTGSVAVGETYTVSYSVTVDAFADQENHVLANIVQNPDGSCDVEGCPETENPIRHFVVEKDADATTGVASGDVVTYTVTVTNDGEGAYTATEPAGFTDDLTDVIDDASYNGDAAAVASDGSTVPAPTVAGAVLAWSGPLAPGESVSITYSVTVTNAGDADLVNTATPVCAPGVICDPVTPPVDIDLPRITPEKSSDPASGTGVVAGDVITYSLTFTNSGQAAGDVASTDDVSEVLDDAEVTTDPTADLAGITATFDAGAEEIRIEGSLPAGATVTVTYQVTVRADGERGDNVLTNVLTPDVPPYVCDDSDPDCDPFVPPSTEHPVGQLAVDKTVDPESGTSVDPGQVVAYTLTFESVGAAASTVDKVDDLSDVLDDAELVAGSITTSDAALTAELQGTDLVVTGSVPAGATYTVSYSVTVDAFADQENHVLANIVQNPDGSCGVEECPETSNPIRHFVVEKDADVTAGVQTGDVVTYTVTVTNDGEGAYTATEPAGFTDDLADVLDDASYNGDAVAVASDGSTVPTPTVTGAVLAWSGPIAAGESVSVTYSVTVTNAGDADLVNAATPVCAPGVVCDPVTPPVDIDLPRITPDKSSDPVSGSGVVAGDVITYSLTFTNSGQAAGDVDSTDDLSAVLDDAEVTTDPTADVAGITATLDAGAEQIRIGGSLPAGAVVTVTYQVTVLPDGERGDNVLTNVLTPDVPPYVCGDTDPDCDPFVPPSTEHPVGQLAVDKTVDPASGTAVDVGQVVTYTLTFESVGAAASTVDKVDDLSDVLDDAALVAGSITPSNAALTAELQGTDLVVTGSIPAGATYTVTYSVTVSAFADQENHVLANVLQNPDGSCGAEECPDTSNPIRHFSVEKDADATAGVRTGDVVTYTVTVTNDGESAYTSFVPAGFTDDLIDVIDDASYNGDAAAVASDGSLVPAPTLEGSVLAWSGPVAVGESVSISYSVTVTNAGDTDLVNTATPVCAPDVACDPVTPPVDIDLPRITPEKSSDPVAGTTVEAGQVVTYTLTFTNSGQGAGDVASSDDMSQVLDDAELTAGPTADVAGITPIFDADAEQIRIEGSLPAGTVVTVTYQVTVLPDGDRGDNILANVLTPDAPPYVCADGDPDCDPFVPPGTDHFIGELRDWKTVDPASGGTVVPGQVVTYTLHFESVGTGPVTVDREDDLTAVLDDATVTSDPVSSDAALAASGIVDGRFGITGSLEPGDAVTVTYQATVNPDGERGDDRLSNYLLDPDAAPPAECVVAEGEEFPDCTVDHVSSVVVVKSADPASGTEVEEGQQVEYTVTFRNVSTDPDAAGADVDYTDHLTDVLDDATLTRGPQASTEALATAVEGRTIRITGSVASGSTVTVTYVVTVQPWADQGNHSLGNVIAVTGEEPICVEGNGLCTTHPLGEPDPLAVTGGQVAVGALAAGVVLLVAGGLLVAIRRRRQSIE